MKNKIYISSQKLLFTKINKRKYRGVTYQRSIKYVKKIKQEKRNDE